MAKSFTEFAAELCARGFATVLVREWAPRTVVDGHSHPFDARALLVRGEMWLTAAQDTRHLGRGDRFEIPAGVSHQERYGPEGATYWVGRRNPDARPADADADLTADPAVD